MIFHQINQLASTTRSNQHYQQPTGTNPRLRDNNWIQEMNQGLRGDGVGEDWPSPDERSVVMTMAMISPSRREVSPAEQLRQSPRLVPPIGGGVSSRKLAYDFFSDERLHIAEDGHRRATRGPTRQGARPGGQGAPPTLVPRVWVPSGIFFAQYFLLFPKITSVEFQDFWSCAEQVSNICSFSSPEFQLPAFSLLM